jgi:hypothetical protein
VLAAAGLGALAEPDPPDALDERGAGIGFDAAGGEL